MLHDRLFDPFKNDPVITEEDWKRFLAARRKAKQATKKA